MFNSTVIMKNADPGIRCDSGRSSSKDFFSSILPYEGVIAQISDYAGQQNVFAGGTGDGSCQAVLK